MNRFDRTFWRRLWTLARPYWSSEMKWTALSLLAASLVLSGTVKAASVVFSYVNRDMMTALTDRNASVFFFNALLIVAYNLVSAPMIALDGWVNGRQMIHWRRWMTERFLDRSLRDRAFYRLTANVEIDNPDQRISEDLNAFPGFVVSFVLQTLWGVVTGASFLVVAWLISPLLVAALAVCVGAGSVLTVVIGRPLIGINFAQRRREADFRHGLVRLRDNAEAIAFYGGERREEKELLKRLGAVLENSKRMIRWQRNLGFFTYAYDLMLVLVPVAVLAPAYFSGRIEFGQITQASAAFVTLRNALSVIVDQFNQLSSFAAVVERLGSYREAIESRDVTAISAIRPVADSERQITVVEAPRFAIESLTLQTPNGEKTLVRNLSVSVDGMRRLLITGESGVGKTSLLRAVAGLWRTGSGSITRPPLGEVMFLPQRPYLVPGSLREQVCYPRSPDVDSDRIARALEQAGLGDLPARVGGLDAEYRWKDLLSLGEQQKIAFARLLLERPAWAFLDEATSALDPATEQRLYDRLRAAGIHVVSVGHRESLAKCHDLVLELRGNGNWTIESPPAAAQH